MSTYDIHFHDKIIENIPNYLLCFFFFSYQKNFLGTPKRVQMNHGKRAIIARVIEVLLYVIISTQMVHI